MNHQKQSQQDKIASLQEQGCLNPTPNKVQDPLFSNNEFFDANDIVQVKYELLRRVQIDGMPITEAVKRFGFSRLSFYRILALFEKLGFAGFIPKKRGPKAAHKITEEVLNFILKQIQNSPDIKSHELQKIIHDKFGLSVHPRSIERALSKKKRKMT